MLNSSFNHRVTLLAIVVVSCLSATNATAQSSFSLVNADGNNVAASVANDARLKSLRHDLHPGIYFRDGELSLREKAATTLITDVASATVIGKEAFATSGIEMVTITVDSPSELSSFVDLSGFSDYERLKYIQVRASFPCSKDDLYRMLKNISTQYLILLNVDPAN